MPRWSQAQGRRREYPLCDQQTKQEFSDCFYFKFIDPETGRIGVKPLKYLSMVRHPASTDILALEADIRCKPSQVLLGLYGKWDEKKIQWIEVGDQDPSDFKDITDSYFKTYRPTAYKGQTDPYGNERPKMLDPTEVYIDQLETLL